jgi:hypothetical protein
VAKAKVKANADRHALDVLPIIIEIRATGKATFGEISAELNTNEASPQTDEVYP